MGRTFDDAIVSGEKKLLPFSIVSSLVIQHTDEVANNNGIRNTVVATQYNAAVAIKRRGVLETISPQEIG